MVIIGAGPAGLTAALELARSSNYHITVVEKSDQVGGISKTVDYKGNLIDLGGHRFFSKHDEVLKWWSQIMPIEQNSEAKQITYHGEKKALPSNLKTENLHAQLLIRRRKSRIYYKNHFFSYPLQFKWSLITGLGWFKSLKIAIGILQSRFFPIRPEENLEDFYINRFGRELYHTFFKEYTYKVWGRHCYEISPEWGRQRVKSLSIRRIILHALRNLVISPKSFSTKPETSLIEYFLYPAKGPGQMWELVKQRSEENGVLFKMNSRVTSIKSIKGAVTSVCFEDAVGTQQCIEADYVISSMPIRPLVKALGLDHSRLVSKIAANLEYRDFLIVGLLLKDIKLKDPNGGLLPDNWLYIQDSGVNLGRLQIFNNWSPYMVADPTQYWIGAEYFCYQSDKIWQMNDEALIELASEELERIGVLNKQDVLDGTVVRCPKAYPSYTGSYTDFEKIKGYLSQFENFFPIGRNGMHKYNNQDHSMLTAFKAVQMITDDTQDFEALWDINTEEAYHEEK